MSGLAVLSFEDDTRCVTDAQADRIRQLWGQASLKKLAATVGCTVRAIERARRPGGCLSDLPRLERPAPEAIQLTGEQVDEIRRLWAAGVPTGELCQQVGVSTWVFESRRLNGGPLSDLPRRKRGTNGGKWSRAEAGRIDVATIEARAAEVRRGWSPEELRFRRGAGRLPDAYRPRNQSMSELADAPARGVISTRAIQAATDARFW
jgi:hypothetical protein